MNATARPRRITPAEFKNVLVVFSRQDEALGHQVEHDLQDWPVDEKKPLRVYSGARNIADALNLHMDPPMHVAIIGQGLARSSSTPVEEHGGIELCKELRESLPTVKLILLVPHIASLPRDASFESACKKHNVICLHTGDIEYLRKHLLSDIRRPKPMLDVILTPRRDAPWEYMLLGTDIFYKRCGTVRLDTGALALASQVTDYIEVLPNDEWYSQFGTLGSTLCQLLCSSKKFKNDLTQGLRQVGGVKQTRVSFCLEEGESRHFPVALESIFPPSNYPKLPWMVTAPLYRYLGPKGARPTVSLQGRLHVLLVAADVDGTLDTVLNRHNQPWELERLPAIENEIKALEKMLQREQRRKTIASVSCLIAERGKPITEEILLRTISEHHWDIVHFAGHAIAKEDGEKESRAYLIIGEPDEPVALEVDKFAKRLSGTKLVYLSGCETTRQAFSIALARHVPVVCGFRWRVIDEFAEMHALLFYRHLLRYRTVDTAAFKTRSLLHRRNPQEKVWASSMLVFGCPQ